MSAGALLVAVLAAACSSAEPPRAAETPAAAVPPVADADLPRWQPIDGLDTPRDDFGTAVVDGDIWVLGGMTGDRGTRLDSIEVLDTGTDTWRVADVRLPEGLASFEAAAVGPRIYVFGGLDVQGRPSDFAAALDTTTGAWQRLPALPVPRYSHTVTLHDGRIHVIGGEGPGGPVEQVDVFDPRTRTWSEGTPMPHARGSHDAVSVGDRIWVLGGWEDGEPSDRVQSYDPDSGRWQSRRPLPEPMSRAGVTYAEGLLWVSLHQTSYTLDPAEGEWREADPMTVSRHGLGYLPVDGRIYAIGGCTEAPLRDVRTVEVLDVSQVSLG